MKKLLGLTIVATAALTGCFGTETTNVVIQPNASSQQQVTEYNDATLNNYSLEDTMSNSLNDSMNVSQTSSMGWGHEGMAEEMNFAQEVASAGADADAMIDYMNYEKTRMVVESEVEDTTYAQYTHAVSGFFIYDDEFYTNQNNAQRVTEKGTTEKEIYFSGKVKKDDADAIIAWEYFLSDDKEMTTQAESSFQYYGEYVALTADDMFADQYTMRAKTMWSDNRDGNNSSVTTVKYSGEKTDDDGAMRFNSRTEYYYSSVEYSADDSTVSAEVRNAFKAVELSTKIKDDEFEYIRRVQKGRENSATSIEVKLNNKFEDDGAIKVKAEIRKGRVMFSDEENTRESSKVIKVEAEAELLEGSTEDYIVSSSFSMKSDISGVSSEIEMEKEFNLKVKNRNKVAQRILIKAKNN